LCQVCDRSFENQQYRATGRNLVVAAITLWNTLYLERAVTRPCSNTSRRPGWEHVGLTGDYLWHSDKRVAKGGFRTLQEPGSAVLSVRKFPFLEVSQVPRLKTLAWWLRAI
jgi:hypothetical protein